MYFEGSKPLRRSEELEHQGVMSRMMLTLRSLFFTMMRCIVALVATLLILGSSEAFSPLPNSISNASLQSSTTVFLFGGKKATNDKTKPAKSAKKEESKKTPMIMMFGKPQYDWVNNREMKENKRRMNWLYKPEDDKRKK